MWALLRKVIGSKRERNSGLTGNRILPGEVLPGELSVVISTFYPINASGQYNVKLFISQHKYVIV